MRRRWQSIFCVGALTIGLLLGGCAQAGAGGADTQAGEPTEAAGEQNSAYDKMEAVNGSLELSGTEDKYRNYYEIFPYSFRDSDGDGVGDLNGITEELDYIADLGIDALWLTPIYPSTTYHKYDVSDYCDIDPQFGTLDDFDRLMTACDERGIDVILDLVVNHSSSHHEWFKEATSYLRSLEPGEDADVSACPYVDYYCFTRELQTGYTAVPGTEDWYYESRFWSEMPDLNLDSEAVRDEIAQIVQFWIDRGVAGFRLDATTSYYTGDDASNIEFMTWLNSCVKDKKPDAYMVGECWSGNVTYTSYYSSGIDSFFDFDFADNTGSIAKVLRGGSAVGFGNFLVSVQEAIAEKNPEAIDAAFTSNHDTGRSAGFYAGDDAKSMTKMGQAIAMMMGGNYYLYYGDELGMKGSGDDENKRCPMQWSADKTAEGMCMSVATKVVEMKYGSLEEQKEDGDSIYYFVKEGLKLRNAYPEIARGTTAVEASVSDENILVLRKTYSGAELLVVMNLSNAEQTVDLSGLTANGNHIDETTAAGMLITGDSAVQIEGSTVTMPAYSVELFR